MTQTTPTRDEAVREPAALAAFLRISSQRRDIPESVRQQIIEAADLLSAPAPASGRVDAVGVCGISADTESKRVLKLHFKHEVTDADRKTIIDAFNTLNRERRSALSPAATPVSEAGGDVLAGWCQPNGITKQAEYDIDRAIGGTYELPDGRSFWLDHVAVKEIMRRAVPVIAAECERHRLIGGRTTKPEKKRGC